MTTPFEREILQHHYVSSAPFPRQTDLYRETVDRFEALGLLHRDGDTVTSNDEALAPYFAALARVPLPQRVWAVPERKKETL